MTGILRIFFALLFCCSRTFAWVVPGVIAGSGIFGALVARPLYCRFKECCSDRWIHSNLSGLKADLGSKLFGQHLASEVVYKAIKGHLTNPNPHKALVLSFHGWTGSGKNHVSRIIANNLYKKGMDSKYTLQVIATHDFPHTDKIDEYRKRLKKLVTTAVEACSRSLFIFDEVDKIPHGLMDTLKPFLDYHHEVDHVNYRKSIFIFLSNTGGKTINQEVFNHWRQGKKREDLTIKRMDDVINKGVFNTAGGLWHSQLILHNLIDYFVPFLPLERRHIKQCIIADLTAKKKPYSEDVVNQVAKELQYDPEDGKVFSRSGCKKVSSKVDFVIG